MAASPGDKNSARRGTDWFPTNAGLYSGGGGTRHECGREVFPALKESVL